MLRRLGLLRLLLLLLLLLVYREKEILEQGGNCVAFVCIRKPKTKKLFFRAKNNVRIVDRYCDISSDCLLVVCRVDTVQNYYCKAVGRGFGWLTFYDKKRTFCIFPLPLFLFLLERVDCSMRGISKNPND